MFNFVFKKYKLSLFVFFLVGNSAKVTVHYTIFLKLKVKIVKSDKLTKMI